MSNISFTQPMITAQESSYYFLKIGNYTVPHDNNYLATFLKKFEPTAYNNQTNNEFTKEKYLKAKSAELMENVKKTDFKKIFVSTKHKSSLGNYNFSTESFPIRINLLDKEWARLGESGNYSYYFSLYANAIINIDEFDSNLRMKKNEAELFLKKISDYSGLPNRAIDVYYYYSIVNQKLEKDYYADIYVHKVKLVASNGSVFWIYPKESFESPTNGIKKVNGFTNYYYTSEDKICSSDENWIYYSVVQRKDMMVIDPVRTYNREGNIIAQEQYLWQYYPFSANKRQGECIYYEFPYYSTWSKSWQVKSSFRNYSSGKLTGIVAEYYSNFDKRGLSFNESEATKLLGKLDNIYNYVDGELNWSAYCEGSIITGWSYYQGGKSTTNDYYVNKNQQGVPSEIMTAVKEYSGVSIERPSKDTLILVRRNVSHSNENDNKIQGTESYDKHKISETPNSEFILEGIFKIKQYQIINGKDIKESLILTDYKKLFKRKTLFCKSDPYVDLTKIDILQDEYTVIWSDCKTAENVPTYIETKVKPYKGVLYGVFQDTNFIFIIYRKQDGKLTLSVWNSLNNELVVWGTYKESN